MNNSPEKSLLPTLERTPFPEIFATLEESIFPNPWSARDFTQDTQHYHFSLWYQGSCMTYAFFRQILDEGELLRIGTLPRFRGMGHADRLMSALLDHARITDLARFFLEVDTTNRQAINLYHKHGFRQVGLRKGYYHGGADALTMAIEL